MAYEIYSILSSYEFVTYRFYTVSWALSRTRGSVGKRAIWYARNILSINQRYCEALRLLLLLCYDSTTAHISGRQQVPPKLTVKRTRPTFARTLVLACSNFEGIGVLAQGLAVHYQGIISASIRAAPVRFTPNSFDAIVYTTDVSLRRPRNRSAHRGLTATLPSYPEDSLTRYFVETLPFQLYLVF